MAMKGKEKAAAGKAAGEIFRVAGPVVTATGLRPRMYDVQFVGEEQLLGEVIQVVGEKTVIQVYEDTSGVRPGEAVLDTGGPLVVELGPGLLGSIYDGIQRPLPVLQKVMGDFILRGVKSPGRTREKSWAFSPKVQPGQAVGPGDVVGTVQEAKNVEHRIMVPPNFRGGKVVQLKEGSFKVDEVVVQLDNGEQVKMHQTWPVRKARPVKERLMPTIPLVTGQRVLDFLFPIAKGGTAAIPGGFGTGKCVVGTTPVFLSDGRLVPIQQLFREAGGGRSGAAEETVHLSEPIGVLTFDGERIRNGRATAVYKGRTSLLTEVRLRSGRSVRLTPVHRLLRFDGRGIVETPAAQLGEGDAVLVPRRLPLAPASTALPLPVRARVADPRARLEIQARLAVAGRRLGASKAAKALGLTIDSYWNHRLGRTAPTVGLAERLGIAVHVIRAGRASHAIRVPHEISAELAEFLGLQLSEGMIKAARVVEFYNNNRELRHRYNSLAKKLFGLEGKERHDATVSAISLTSRALALLLEAWGVPLRSKSRTLGLTRCLAGASEDAIAEFLRAYAAGDGHFAEEGLEIATASRAMAGGLGYLFARLGIFARVTRKVLGNHTYFRVWVSPKEASKIFPAYEADRFYDSYDVVSLDRNFVSSIQQARGRGSRTWSGAIKNAMAGERVGRATIRAWHNAVSSDSGLKSGLGQLDTML